MAYCCIYHARLLGYGWDVIVVRFMLLQPIYTSIGSKSACWHTGGLAQLVEVSGHCVRPG